MNEESFQRQVKTAQERLADLRRRIDALPEHERQGLLAEAAEGLSIALEELQVTSEEMHQQNEELATARLHSEMGRHRYQELFNLAPEGYLVTDPEGTIQEINRAASTLLSVPQSFLIGKPLAVFVKEEDLRAFRTQLSRLPALERVEDWEILLQPRDGEPFPAAITITTVRDSNGKLAYLRWIVHDTSERKRTEEKLRQSENRLRSLSEKLLTVQENERKKVARDLHDSLMAILAAAKFDIEATLQLLQGDGTDKKVTAPLEHAVATIQNIFEEVRRIYMDLRPPLLDDLGIQAAISWFIREFQKVYPRIRVERDIDIDESNLPEPIKIVVYRVLQEAFINVAKHSKADRVHFSLVRRDHRMEMTIEDNGEGFNVGQTLDVNHPQNGFGLLLMREKIELSGGSLKIISSEGGETVIRASWPIPPS